MPEAHNTAQALHIAKGSILAFDFGTKRIGVAIGEWPLAHAHPLTTIQSEINAERFAAISALINEWQPVHLIVGLPVAVDGQAHQLTARCTRFANQLRGRFALPVAYAEERFSSIEASCRLRAEGQIKKRTHQAAKAVKAVKAVKAQIDAAAAQIILQDFFDQQVFFAQRNLHAQ